MKHNPQGIDAAASLLASKPAEEAVYAIPIPQGIKHIADMAVCAMMKAASLSKSNFLYRGTISGNVIRYAGVKLPVRMLKPPMRVVKTIITITFILFPSFVVIAETIVSNTPASVSIWKYKNANKSINPADFIMEDIRQKVESVEGVTTATINLVFEPEWDKDMMSEEAKLELGFL